MASYTLLYRGDRLPTVGVLQALLNRSGKTILTMDGVFGRRTEAALIDFQAEHGLPADGIVDKPTWERLQYREVLPLVDVVDVFEQRMWEQQATYLVQSGGQPVFLGGMSNGVAQMAQQISSARQIFLLRITGHAAPGGQGISFGKGGWIEKVGNREVRHLFPHDTSLICRSNLSALPTAIIKQIFGPYSSVELHGCHVAQGVKGRDFVKALAQVLGVPVTGGSQTQHGSFHFEGPTFTALPNGQSLASWCAGLPEFEPVAVP